MGKSKKVRIHLQAEEKERDAFDKAARADHRSRSEWIRVTLKRAIEKAEAK